MITVEILRKIFTIKEEKAKILIEPLNVTLVEFEINNAKRQTAFLAQVGHESGQFLYMKELWGPTPQQLKYEPHPTTEEELKKGKPLFMRLGNTEKGDGVRFKGRGLIQVTGRANYETCGKALNLDLLTHPELLEEPLNACRSAGWFWKSKGLNEWADKEDFVKITRIINGGENGLKERTEFYEKAKKVLV
jgi:putative chitinase